MAYLEREDRVQRLGICFWCIILCLDFPELHLLIPRPCNMQCDHAHLCQYGGWKMTSLHADATWRLCTA